MRPCSGYERPIGLEDNTLTQKDLVSFAYQVARGMDYLASKKVLFLLNYYFVGCLVFKRDRCHLSTFPELRLRGFGCLVTLANSEFKRF